MWQRFLINLAKYRTGVRLTDSIREAILVLGGNGIVEDFSVLPRLLRDSIIIETWEGSHNTICLQILRDATRSDLVERWQGEVSRVLETWPRDFLSFTRGAFERMFAETSVALSRKKLTDAIWVTTHARRLVDRMGLLLEMAWLAEMAFHTEDSTAALLASSAGYFGMYEPARLEHPVIGALADHGTALIEEEPIKADVTGL
jgi:hypothetical protein